MRVQRRFATLLILLASLLGIWAPARAQTSLTLELLEIELWPEFDRPSMLVLVNGALPVGTPLPATVTLQFPTQPFAVAERTADGTLLNAQYVTATTGSEVAVTLTLQQPGFRVEYYDPALTITGEARQYTFQWTTPVAARLASVRVQAPPDATNLQFEPEFGAATAGEYGLSYYATDLGAVTAGQRIAVTIRYSKPGSTLTIDQVNAAPQPAPITVSEPVAAVDYTPWIIGAAALSGVLIAGIGVWWYWRSQRSARPKPKHHRARKPTQREPAVHSTNGTAAGQRFCTQCGQALVHTDRFCRQCGTPVKA
jgi:hypothetical protein